MSMTLEQSEMFLLGQLLASPQKLMDLKVTTDHFSIGTNRMIFESMIDMEKNGSLIDVVSVSCRLTDQDPTVNWLPLLGQYQMDSFSSTFFETSQTEILKKHKEREIKKISHDLQQDMDVDKAIRELMGLDYQRKNYSYSMKQAVIAAIEKAQMTAEKDGMTGLPTGLTDLDAALGGLQSPDLIIIGARPSVGKTAFALNLMLKNNAPVLFFSTEQPYEQIGLRAVSAESMVSGRKIRTADFSDNEFNLMTAACVRLQSSKIQIYDKGVLNLSDLMREARRQKYNNDIQAIYVDYIQRMKVDGQDRREGLGEIVRGLKSLAKELNVPVIALAQINREVEKRIDKRPRMGDLKDSGEIEQEADEVILLYRDDVYNPDSDQAGIMELIIDKNRHGPTGSLKVTWLADTMRVADFEYRY